MSKNLLFAVDERKEEVVVSDSPKGTNKIDFIERIQRKDNEMLYYAVMTLSSITKSPNMDVAVFKAMDKVCQMMYERYKGDR